ncbi:hypothetical protein [Saccharospirillum impatiens]|uniref:hypothetical protein n=1 Tax=Saccharospirillum impatiens TaxID=169438 RepID=UPI000412E72B|nr:hypothetical protein [Saccharospirillum impatiens]
MKLPDYQTTLMRRLSTQTASRGRIPAIAEFWHGNRFTLTTPIDLLINTQAKNDWFDL